MTPWEYGFLYEVRTVDPQANGRSPKIFGILHSSANTTITEVSSKLDVLDRAGAEGWIVGEMKGIGSGDEVVHGLMAERGLTAMGAMMATMRRPKI